MPTDKEEHYKFWSKVLVGDGCWEWSASRHPDGYGQFRVAGLSSGKAHRRSWELANGPIPNGMHVLHHCDNPGCVNPSHLFLGTPVDNARDRDRKGRHGDVRGERHGRAVLTEQRVKDIRSRYAEGWITQRELASEYGVAVSTINFVITRRNWSHI